MGIYIHINIYSHRVDGSFFCGILKKGVQRKLFKHSKGGVLEKIPNLLKEIVYETKSKEKIDEITHTLFLLDAKKEQVDLFSVLLAEETSSTSNDDSN